MLKHDEIAFSLFVLHQLFKTSTKGVEQVVALDNGGIVREQTDPLQPRDDTSLLGFRGEGDARSNSRDDGTTEKVYRVRDITVGNLVTGRTFPCRRRYRASFEKVVPMSRFDLPSTSPSRYSPAILAERAHRATPGSLDI